MLSADDTHITAAGRPMRFQQHVHMQDGPGRGTRRELRQRAACASTRHAQQPRQSHGHCVHGARAARKRRFRIAAGRVAAAHQQQNRFCWRSYVQVSGTFFSSQRKPIEKAINPSRGRNEVVMFFDAIRARVFKPTYARGAKAPLCTS